jgi:hypothetical protein
VKKDRQADQDAKLSAWVNVSGSSIKKSELLNPAFIAYVHSLDPSTRILSQTDITDYSIAEREVSEMALKNENDLIMKRFTFGNPHLQIMADHVTVHGIKMLSEAACFAPANAAPPMVIATNFTRTPDGSADAQGADVDASCKDIFGLSAVDVALTSIFDEGAVSTGNALEIPEDSCGMHVDSSCQKDMMGANRTVNGQPSNDFPEITELMGKCRDLGKFILRPKVWSSFEKKRNEMDDNREKRINFWRVVLDHCKTRIGAVLSLAESVALDRAMTKIMFSLWGTANADYPAPDKMPSNLTDAEYTVLDEFVFVMGIAKPHQLFTQYEKWYTAALEIIAQKQVQDDFQQVVDEDGSALVLDTAKVAGETKKKSAKSCSGICRLHSTSKKLAARGLEFSKSPFSTDKISARRKIASRIDPRTYKLPWCDFREKAAYTEATSF